MRRFTVPKLRKDTVELLAESRIDLARHQIGSLRAVAARTQKRVAETRALLRQVDIVLEEFSQTWRRSP